VPPYIPYISLNRYSLPFFPKGNPAKCGWHLTNYHLALCDQAYIKTTKCRVLRRIEIYISVLETPPPHYFLNECRMPRYIIPFTLQIGWQMGPVWLSRVNNGYGRIHLTRRWWVRITLEWRALFRPLQRIISNNITQAMMSICLMTILVVHAGRLTIKINKMKRSKATRDLALSIFPLRDTISNTHV